MSDAGEKPRLSDADMLARFQNSKKRPPCSETLGMRLIEVEQNGGAVEFVEIRLQQRRELLAKIG